MIIHFLNGHLRFLDDEAHFQYSISLRKNQCVVVEFEDGSIVEWKTSGVNIVHCEDELVFKQNIYEDKFIFAFHTPKVVNTYYKQNAYWVYKGRDNGYFCSNCKSRCLLDYNSEFHKSSHCPHCGMKMDNEERWFYDELEAGNILL